MSNMSFALVSITLKLSFSTTREQNLVPGNHSWNEKQDSKINIPVATNNDLKIFNFCGKSSNT